MIKQITDHLNNLYGLIGVALGAVAGIIVAVIQTKSKAKQQESLVISELRHELDDLKSRFDSLKVAFSIVFDQYERDFINSPEKLSMLKDLKKIFEL